jgi:hypothetical protein
MMGSFWEARLGGEMQDPRGRMAANHGVIGMAWMVRLK